MANQDFDLAGMLKVRLAEENDAQHLQAYCFPDKTNELVTEELQADLAEGSQTHRLVAEASGYAIGQIRVKQHPLNNEIGQVENLAVSGPFRQLGVADHLIKAAEATASANGMKTLEIELSLTDGSVIQRYKDWGFAEKPLVTLQKVLDAEEEAETPAESESSQSEETPSSGEQQELLDQ